jgi:lysophospholipase L1-like esterase
MRRSVAAGLFGLVGGALILAGLEVSSRLLRPVAPVPALIHPVLGEWAEHDALLFWRLRPHVVVDGAPLTNALGLRGPEVPPRTPDEFRILSLGESTTFGRRLAWEDTYSGLLQAGTRRVDGREVRVVNAGIPGYTIFQGATYLEHRGLALGPDLVLVYFGYNDFLPVTPAHDPELTRATDAERFARMRSPLGRLRFALAAHSNLFRLVSARRRSGTRAVTPDWSSPRVPEADRLASLRGLHRLCERAGIRLVLVVPWYRSFEEHTLLLRRFAAANDVWLADLPELLRAPPRPRESYFVDTVHPNADGHRLIADALQASLQRMWGRRAELAPPAP